MQGTVPPLMVFPVASSAITNERANAVAAADRSDSHNCMMSSSVETPPVRAPGCAFVRAAFNASMIGPSSIPVRSAEFFGDCPCLAEAMIAVEPANPCDNGPGVSPSFS